MRATTNSLPRTQSFHLDDCWAGGRNATGFLYPEMDHFPNGMKTVVDYAHSKGLSFGLCVTMKSSYYSFCFIRRTSAYSTYTCTEQK